MDCHNNTEFKMLHWNANGISNFSKLKQFELLLERENIKIASLNETFFTEEHKPYFENYCLYRNDRQDARGGGVALLIHRSIKHKNLSLFNTKLVENISIEITINSRPFVITSAYSPRYTSNLSNDILLLTSSNKDYIILGDLNAKHSAWNCRTYNTAGNVLNNLQQSCNFFIHYPNCPTLYPHQRNRESSTVDIAISNTAVNIELETMGYEIPSDHRPVICTLKRSMASLVDLSFYDYKASNWNTYKNYIDDKIVINSVVYNSKASIDQEIDKFVKVILEARDVSTPKVTHRNNYILPENIIKYIKLRKAYKRKSQRTTNVDESNFYDQYSKFLTKLIDKSINMERNRKWSNLLNNLKPGDKAFWKISRSLRGKNKNQIPYLNNGNTRITSDSQKAEILAKSFEQANNLTTNYKHSNDTSVNAIVKNFKKENPDSVNAILTSFSELNYLVSSLKSSKSPGFDNVPNLLLKKLPAKALNLLVLIFNSCIKLNYFPKKFKTAKVIAIHKPGKPKNNPSSYRPISLLSNLGKLFEKIVHTRLYEYVSDNSIISHAQFGFRKEHSTTHQINRIKNKIITNRRNKRSTGMILLDIEKAFDTVWHNGLLYKLIAANIPKYLCKIIADFIENRMFTVCVNNETSSAKTITTGLPQGSVLSPLLYSIYTSDFRVPAYMETAYYADDTALITSSKLTSALLKKMEKGLLACNKYFQKWKIKINPNKTQAIVFPFNKSPKRIPRRQLFFGNDNINVNNDVKYLGVYLDKKLIFKKHIDETCQKAIKIFKALWPLLNRRSHLSFKNKNLLFKSVIRPTLTYACPIWYTAANCHLKKLQIIQNKCLKMIHIKHWRYPTFLLHQETGYETIIDFIARLNLKYFDKIENSTYPLIRECRELT